MRLVLLGIKRMAAGDATCLAWNEENGCMLAM